MPIQRETRGGLGVYHPLLLVNGKESAWVTRLFYQSKYDFFIFQDRCD